MDTAILTMVTNASANYSAGVPTVEQHGAIIVSSGMLCAAIVVRSTATMKIDGVAAGVGPLQRNTIRFRLLILNRHEIRTPYA